MKGNLSMDTRIGKITNDINEVPPKERKFYVPVQRDMSAKEKADTQIRLYSPCACGSGKTFKFCCYRKAAA